LKVLNAFLEHLLSESAEIIIDNIISNLNNLAILTDYYIKSIFVFSKFLALHVLLQLELVTQLLSLFSTSALSANIKLSLSWR
jgi:hypothetical protein